MYFMCLLLHVQHVASTRCAYLHIHVDVEAKKNEERQQGLQEKKIDVETKRKNQDQDQEGISRDEDFRASRRSRRRRL